MSSFTDIFIKRPVFAICLNLIIVVAGYQAINNLTTRQYPKSDLAVVKVLTTYIGADADLVRGFISTPLEKAIASADGIDYISSSSAPGLSTINAHLELNYNIYDALSQIQTKIAEVRNDLPQEAEAPIVQVETTDNRFASMYLSFFSDSLNQNEITDYLLRVVQPKLSSVPGVQKADILGARIFAVRIWLKPELMAALNVSADQVQQALRSNNYLGAPGKTKGAQVSINLKINSDLQSLKEFQDLVIKNEGDAVVRLRDIADIEMGAESYNEEVRFDGKTATFMGIWVLPDSNSLEVIKNARKVFPEIIATLPPALEFDVPYDATAYIDDSINEVIKTLAETVFIVIIVIFVFIGSLRSVLVPVIAIPLSLLGAVVIMYLLGFTLNLLTLLAIVLAVGLVVDDAIVMLENVERHVSEGKSPREAAFIAARELVLPIMAMTITLAAVYAPIGIQGGLTGTLFREFAFTLAGAVLVSGFVAVTLSPMMSAYFVKENHTPNKFQSRVNQYFRSLKQAYLTSLAEVLNNRKIIMVSAVIVMLLLIPFYMFSQKELAPREDQGVLFGLVLADANATLDQTVVYTAALNKQMKTFAEYKTSFQLTSSNFGFSGIVTKPWSERQRTTQEMLPEAAQKFGSIPGVMVIADTPPPLPGGSDFPVEFVISSTASPESIYGYAQQLVGAAFQSGHFMFADTDVKFDQPETSILLDRDQISTMGLSLQSVANQLSFMTADNFVNRFNYDGRSYKVIPQLQRRDRLTPEQLKNIYITGPQQKLIPLSTVASLDARVQARELRKFQQLNSVTVRGAYHPGTNLNNALTALETAASEILPKTYQVDYAGESRQLRKEGSKFLGTMVFSLIFIYLVLAAQFESFRDPLIILLGSVPLAITASLVFSFLGFTSMNIYSQVGLVTLVGLIAKNGILLVEFANQLREQGVDRLTAIQESASKRFRPILMTSLATVVGHTPLILASGAGAAARNSIGIMLVTGMFIGTFFTFFVLPVIYLQFSKND